MAPALDTDQRPLVLVWEMTQACELACKHCRADAQPDRHPGELTTAEAESLLEETRKFGPGQLVVLSGGDPLARDDVTSLVRFGVDLGLQMTLTPSGTSSLTADRVRSLADAGLRRLALSLDGPTPESHDDFRGEDGSYADTIAAAEAARDADLPLQINTTVCAETVEYLPRLRNRVRDLGAVMWSVFFLVPIGRGSVLDSIGPGRAERVMAWLAEVADTEPFALKTTEAPHYRRVRLQRGETDTRPSTGHQEESANHAGRPRITAGDGFAFVSHLGEVYPSGFLPLSAGNVREKSVVSIYREADLFQSLRDPTALEGKCGACPYRGVCGGSRSRAFAMTGDPLASDPLCAYVPEEYNGPLPPGIARS